MLIIYKNHRIENTIQLAIDNPKISPQKVQEFNDKGIVKFNGNTYICDQHNILGD